MHIPRKWASSPFHHSLMLSTLLLPFLLLLLSPLQQPTFGFIPSPPLQRYHDNQNFVLLDTLPRGFTQLMSRGGRCSASSGTSIGRSHPVRSIFVGIHLSAENGHDRNDGDRGEKSTTPQRQRSQGDGKGRAIERNSKIMFLGKQGKWKEILVLYQQESKEFNNVNYATAMSQFQRIRSLDRGNPLFMQFVDDIDAKIAARGLDWIGVQGIANIAHAIGKMRLRSRSSRRIVEAASRMVGTGNPQAVANTAWACASLGMEAPKLFSDIEQRASWLVEEGNPQAVANTAWACTTLGVESPKLFSEIERRAAWLVEEGNPQNVANTAWACAGMGVRSPELFSEIERRATWLVMVGTPQAVANTAWACATLGMESPNLFSEIETRASWLINKGKPQAIANTAWACASLGIEAPRLFAEIETRASRLVEEGKPQAVANTAWACATLGVESPMLFSEIERHASRLVEKGNARDIATTAWACTTLGIDSPNLFSEIERRRLTVSSEHNSNYTS